MVTTPEQMDPIESREIRGLSARALFWLVGSTGTIVIFVASSYFMLQSHIKSIDAKIDQVQKEKVYDDKYNDLRLKVIEANVDALKGTVDNLRNQVSTNSRTIENSQQKK